MIVQSLRKQGLALTCLLLCYWPHQTVQAGVTLSPHATSQVSENTAGQSDHLFSLDNRARVAARTNHFSGNCYPIGQCTWGVKELAPWAHTYWGNGGDWAANAASDGFTIGNRPSVGAIAVWTDPYGGYGHVAYVTAVQSETCIQVLEANIGGNPTIANYRGYFDPTTTAEGMVSYIYPVKP